MLNQKYIVYTRNDGGVSICAPSLTALSFMTNGGGRWDGYNPGFLDRQIEAQAQYGVGERAARSFVMAMQFGGYTEAEAYGVMLDRFCAHLGTGCELWSRQELPNDRWFRDAWRRSANGGPIRIDMKVARKVQMRHIKTWCESHRLEWLPDLWRARIRRAETPEELCHVIPVLGGTK